MTMLKWIDRQLDRLTMYRLALYYLAALLLAAVCLSGAGLLQYSPLAIVFSAVYLLAVCWLANRLFASVWGVPSNPESSLITALILSLIITPVSAGDGRGLAFLTAAGLLAVASKYLLAIRGAHVFNPAAVAVVLTAYGAGQSASWWVGGSLLLPFVLAGGLLLTRKDQRFQMVLAFVATAYLAALVYSLAGQGNSLSVLRHLTLGSALFFLGFVMLTEPLTSPTTRRWQLGYAVLVGLLLPPGVHVGSIYTTPEAALLAGNIFAFVVSRRIRTNMRLVRAVRMTADSADFIFAPERPFGYQAGQYMEWTLPHSPADSRGVRRFLTLASSPTEPEIHIGVKFYENGSSFKHALATLTSDAPVIAGQLGGDFTLPRSRRRKLAFIAGGIGITPYRSMLQYLMDKGEDRSVTLLYSVRDAGDVAYADVLAAARQQLGAQVVCCLTAADAALPPASSVAPGSYRRGRITADTIRQEIADYRERLFYISGPRPLVDGAREALRELGVPRANIRTDFFAGY